MIKLFKFINNEWVFVDFGLPSMVDVYCTQGFICQH